MKRTNKMFKALLGGILLVVLALVGHVEAAGTWSACKLDEHCPQRPHGHSAARRPGARQRRLQRQRLPGQRGNI